MDVCEISRLIYVYILRFKVLNPPANDSIRINFPDDKHVTLFMFPHIARPVLRLQCIVSPLRATSFGL